MWSNKLLVKFYQLFWHTHEPSIAQQIFTLASGCIQNILANPILPTKPVLSLSNTLLSPLLHWSFSSIWGFPERRECCQLKHQHSLYFCWSFSWSCFISASDTVLSSWRVTGWVMWGWSSPGYSQHMVGQTSQPVYTSTTSVCSVSRYPEQARKIPVMHIDNTLPSQFSSICWRSTEQWWSYDSWQTNWWTID